tara:strand:- start:5715 stop:6434 length:720 start_codon:yes stop_codon:yes gene_type:complete
MIIITIIYIIYQSKKTYFKNDNDNKFYIEVDNFLTHDECDSLINDSKKTLEDASVMSADKDGNAINVLDSVRTSKNTWLKNDSYKNIIDRVNNLVNKYSKNKVNKKQFENIQVAKYNINGEYKGHYDICHPLTAHSSQLQACIGDYKKYNSIRYATIILYLNDGFDGGETEFPLINKKIIPKKGKALLFFNCTYNEETNKNGLCDTINNSFHAGLPIKPGKINEKWIANIWIRTKIINF